MFSGQLGVGGAVYNHKKPLPGGAAGKGTVEVALQHLFISSHFQKHLTRPPGVRSELLPISEHLSVAEPASSQTRPPATWPRPLPAPTGHSSSHSLCICSCLPASLLNISYFIVKPVSYHHTSSSSSATSEQTLKRSTVPTTGQATPDTSARQPGHGSWNLSDPPSQLLFSSLSVTPKPAGASAQLVHL